MRGKERENPEMCLNIWIVRCEMWNVKCEKWKVESGRGDHRYEMSPIKMYGKHAYIW